MQEGNVIGIIFLILILFKAWKSRKAIKEWFFMGWNYMAGLHGMPPYIPKDKENDDGKIL